MTDVGPGDLSPREAMDRFISDRRADSTDWTIRTYRYQLRQFVQWCEEEQVERVSDLNGWTLNEFRRARQERGNAPVTVSKMMMTVRLLLKFCVQLDAVDESLPEKVRIPKLSKEQESSDKKLATEDAEALLSFYRESPAHYGTAQHALLEVLWNTGARMGGVQALDLGDYYPEEQFLDFVHRPDTGTPLKNKSDGERPVAIPEAVCDVLDTFIARERSKKRCEYGREPLFTSRQGRASDSTIRCWCYMATQPCVYMRCPHGERRQTCEYRRRNYASGCPSSRAPHHVRTGSITWHRDGGIPLEVTSARVNAAAKTIERHYDKTSKLEKMEKRRRQFTEDLDI